VGTTARPGSSDDARTERSTDDARLVTDGGSTAKSGTASDDDHRPHPNPEVQERLDALDAESSTTDGAKDAARRKKRDAEEHVAGRRGVRTPLRSTPGSGGSAPSRPGPFSSMLDEFSKLFLLGMVILSLLLGFAISALQLVPTG
jgi:hypothetical protein